jgi:Ni/Co efflux regulator RcnB
VKKILSAALAVSLMASAGAAAAQPHDNRNHQKQSQAERYDRQDDRRDDRADRRDDRRADKAQDKYERRADKAQDKYERRAAKRYAAARYQRPAGYQQRHWRYGERLPASYRSRAYVVDHSRYGLQAPPRGYQYTRVDNDVILTQAATGVIASVILGMFQ